MSEVCKEWYKNWKKRYDENIHLWNTDTEECAKKITGAGVEHNAWKMLQISGAMERMGGFANFSYYANHCAEDDYKTFANLEAEVQELKAENGKLRESNKMLMKAYDLLKEEQTSEGG